MEPLGEYLKEVREKKRLSVEKVIEDTHILKKFILGIECDDFTAFPGEAYLKGFLRNYSEYLGLDQNDVIRRYEKIKLSETPSPIEQLIPKPGFDYTRIIFVLIVMIAFSLLGTGMFFIYTTISKNSGVKDVKVVEKPKIEKKVEKQEDIKILGDSEITTDMKVNEKIGLQKDEMLTTFWISNLDPTVVMTSSTGKEQFLIGNNYTNKYDIDGDGKDDVEIVLNYWDAKSARLLIRKTVSTLVNESNIDSRFFLNDSVEVLYEGTEKAAISISLTAAEDMYVKYQADTSAEVENKYTKNSTFTINAENQVVLWSTNSGALNATLSKTGKKIVLGDPGELGVRVIAWTKKDANYILQMSALK